MTQRDVASYSDDSPVETRSAKDRSKPAQLPVTVVIPVKNEEQNLPQCLARLQRFAQVVVVDSGSTDRTKEIATNSGATILDFVWDGEYPKKRNWVLMTYKFNTPWVLFLDADEFISVPFSNELERLIHSTDNSGFWLRYTNYFLGHELRYGLPQRKLALFRVDAGLYERIEESNWSNLDMEVHEHPVLIGKIGEIKTPIRHEDYKGLDRFLERHINYARWESRRYKILREKGHENLTDRQKVKYRYIDRWWFPWGYFFYTYIAKFGFLDGRPGFSYAFYKLWYFFSIRNLILEDLAIQS
ncbi:MAG: glycosyltransferase family 2 protein [Mesorhizobium sp.]|uniref:glycosyltransferase family 2 protein n=1 Tax=Mesorhizobium sp. TaxID=1871066 RepID=UPI0011FCD84A|nr:glycosyltransferase family 2 protein [Mesorhizobium sp.]TIL62942.1 MAG: glycosyltransferase family 2 protein [Mesorhizobium sp.]